ncbi:hypothetical protein BCS86_21145 [Vibrio splendidus]|nr:hypothetical protein BCS86_21145 [Vibrio splendidus]
MMTFLATVQQLKNVSIPCCSIESTTKRKLKLKQSYISWLKPINNTDERQLLFTRTKKIGLKINRL